MIKKISPIILGLIMLITSMAVPVTANASDTSSDDAWVYEELADGTLKITGVKPEKLANAVIDGRYVSLDELIFPNTINGKTVTQLGETIIDENTTAGDSRLNELKTIIIPKTITKISENTLSDSGETTSSPSFVNTPGLTKIVVADDNNNYCSQDGVLFNKDKTRLISFPTVKGGNYIIPNSVKEIDIAAFYYCDKIVGLYIPDSVKELPFGMIINYGSSSELQHIRLPEGLITLKEDSFLCSLGFDMEIPKSVTDIKPCSVGDEWQFFGSIPNIYGYTDYVRNVTEKQIVASYVDANKTPMPSYDYSKFICTNHEWGEWHYEGYEGTDPCPKEQYSKEVNRTRTCSICGKTDSERCTIRHDFKEERTEATCSKDVSVIKTCNKCGLKTEKQYQNGTKTGHNYVNGICSKCGLLDPSYSFDGFNILAQNEKDKTCTIIDYTGNEKDVIIPDKIAGFTVTGIGSNLNSVMGEHDTTAVNGNYYNDKYYKWLIAGSNGNIEQLVSNAVFNLSIIDSVTLPTTIKVLEENAFGNAYQFGKSDTKPTIKGYTNTFVYNNYFKSNNAYVPFYNFEILGDYTHEHNYSKKVKPATCTEDGTTTYTCDLCGESHTNVEEKATGHDYVITDKKDATCQQAGNIDYKCSKCGNVKHEYLNQLKHSYELINDKAPNCTEKGHKYYKCSVCGELKTEDYGEQFDHNYSIIQHLDATKEKDGLNVYQCSNCKETYTEVIEKLSNANIADEAWKYEELADGTLKITGIDFSKSGISSEPGETGKLIYTISDLNIPDTINGKTVTQLGSSLILDNDYNNTIVNVSRVIIPATITKLNVASSNDEVAAKSFIANQIFKSYIVAGDNKNYSSLNGVLFNKDQSQLIALPQGINGNYVIPDSVTSIAEGAFTSTNQLVGLYIPDTVKELPPYMIIGINSGSLQYLRLPETINNLPDNCFLCELPKTLIVPKSITSIKGASIFGGGDYYGSSSWQFFEGKGKTIYGYTDYVKTFASEHRINYVDANTNEVPKYNYKKTICYSHTWGEWQPEKEYENKCGTIYEHRECKICGASETQKGTAPHTYEMTDMLPATCTKNGYKIYKCSQCGETYTESLIAVHHYIKGVCTKCGDVAAESDMWDFEPNAYDELGNPVSYRITKCKCSDENVIVPVSIGGLPVTEIGYNYKDSGFEDNKKAIVFDCKNITSITIPNDMYVSPNQFKTYDNQRVLIKGYENTYAESIYLLCKDNFLFEKIGADEYKHNHNYDYKATVYNTCTRDGITVSVCDTCGKPNDNAINTPTQKTGHNYKITNIINNNCEGKSYTIYKCLTCDETYTEEKDITKTEHDYKLISHTEQSCYNNGVDTYKCSKCGDTYYKTTPASHDYGQNNDEAVCKRCGLKNKYISKISYSSKDDIRKYYQTDNYIVINSDEKDAGVKFLDAWKDNKTELIIIDGSSIITADNDKSVFSGKCIKQVVGIGKRNVSIDISLANDNNTVIFDNVVIKNKYVNADELDGTHTTGKLELINCKFLSGKNSIKALGNSFSAYSSEFDGVDFRGVNANQFQEDDCWDNGGEDNSSDYQSKNIIIGTTCNINDCDFVNSKYGITVTDNKAEFGTEKSTFNINNSNFSKVKYAVCSNNKVISNLKINNSNFDRCKVGVFTNGFSGRFTKCNVSLNNNTFERGYCFLWGESSIAALKNNTIRYTNEFESVPYNEKTHTKGYYIMDKEKNISYLKEKYDYKSNKNNYIKAFNETKTKYNIDYSSVDSPNRYNEFSLGSLKFWDIETEKIDDFSFDYCAVYTEGNLAMVNNDISYIKGFISSENDIDMRNNKIRNCCLSPISYNGSSWMISSTGKITSNNDSFENNFSEEYLGFKSEGDFVTLQGETAINKFGGLTTGTHIIDDVDKEKEKYILNYSSSSILSSNEVIATNTTFNDNINKCIKGNNVVTEKCSFTNNINNCIFGINITTTNTSFINNSTIYNPLILSYKIFNNTLDAIKSSITTESDQNIWDLFYASLTNNSATNLDEYSGAAILGLGTSTIDNCIFKDNVSVNGGAINLCEYNKPIYKEYSTTGFWHLIGYETISKGNAIIKNSSFTDNKSLDNGGAIYSASTVNCDDNINQFTDNKAENYGGAIYAPSVSLKGSTLNYNKAKRGSYCFVTEKAITNEGTSSSQDATICLGTNSAVIECNEISSNSVNVSTLPGDRQLGRQIVINTSSDKLIYPKSQFVYCSEDTDKKKYIISNDEDNMGKHLSEVYTITYIDSLTGKVIGTQEKEWNIALNLTMPVVNHAGYKYLGYSIKDSKKLITDKKYSENKDLTLYSCLDKITQKKISNNEPNKVNITESQSVKTGGKVFLTIAIIIAFCLAIVLSSSKKKGDVNND